MKAIVSVLKGICVIALVIGICTFGITELTLSTVLSKKYILDKFEKTDYYINTYSNVYTNIGFYVEQSGLDKNITENTVSLDDVKEGTAVILANIYNGERKEVDASKFMENLRNNINKSIEGKNLSFTTQEAIEHFIEQMGIQYQDSLLHTEFEGIVSDIVKKAQHYFEIIRNISLGIIVVSAIIIIVSSKKKIWKNVARLGIPFVSSGLLYEFINIYIKIKVDVDNIMILSDAFTNSLRSILSDVFGTIVFLGVLMICIGAGLIYLGNSKCKK